jgi:hypothetical protein
MPGGRMTTVLVGGHNVCDAEMNARKMYPDWTLTGNTILLTF